MISTSVNLNLPICQMGINKGGSASRAAWTGVMQIASEGGSKSILENKCVDKYPLPSVTSERQAETRWLQRVITLTYFPVLVHIRPGNIPGPLLFVPEPSTVPGIAE